MKERVVGLDIGSFAVKAVEARTGSGGSVVIERLASAPVPAGAVERGVIKDESVGAISAVLSQAWSEGRLSTRDVVLGIGGEQTYVTEAFIPWVAPAELDKALPYLIKSENLLPVNPAEFQTDHVVLGEEGEGRDRRLALMLFSVFSPHLDKAVAAAAGADLNVVGVDLAPLANLRSISTVRHDATLVDALVDVGADITTVTIHSSGVPRSVQHYPGTGGFAVTKAVQKYAKVAKWDDAELAKTSWLSETGDPDVGTALSRGADSVVAAVRAGVNAYLKKDLKALGLAGITLTGGSALLAGLVAALETAFDVPTSFATYESSIRSKNRGGIPATYHDKGVSMTVSTGLVSARRVG